MFYNFYSEKKYKASSRAIASEKGIMLLSSADSLEFKCRCFGRLAVYIDCEGEGDCYFTVYIDGVRCNARYHVSGGRNVIIPRTDLAEGEHTIKLVRQNEWGRGDTYITDVEINGELLDPPENKELFIEFVGDSLVTGFGNQPDVYSEIEWGGASAYQDATRAYPYLISEALDCDVSVVAVQGIGTSCGGWEFTMNDIYDIYPRINEKDYHYSPDRVADIVVIHLLGNDKYEYEARGFTLDDVFKYAAELCRMARAKHPGADIIFCPADFCEQGAAMVEKTLGGASEGYYSTVLYMDAFGKGGHPSADGHISARDVLVTLIKKIIEEKKVK